MREYGSISPRFWIGETGKLLRGDPEAQVLALYLMTSPHANMIGIFHCPILYMAHETGLSLEGASKALTRLIQAGFCTYDEPSETVFVIRMAAHQIGERLKADDKRVLGVRREVDRIQVQALREKFVDLYAESFHLERKPLPSPSKAPPKQLTRQEQEQDSVMSGKPDPAKQVLEYLNETAGRDFRPVPANLRLIQARMKEGASVDDCRSVIESKFAEWRGNPEMEKYLRPETLFNATKFAQYIGNKPMHAQEKKVAL